MESSGNVDRIDPWQMAQVDAETADAVAENALTIKTIENVEPLDTQFGVVEKKTVPDTLHDALFGESKPTETEIAAAGGDVTAVPPMRTYAILDAAKMVNLPELLENSGLEYRCLFKGDAFDELKNVAPWVVRLEEGNQFTIHLFSRGNAYWFQWDVEPGIYLRSRAEMNELWQHFRKFTRVQDENGKWNYFRFWEVQGASAYWRYLQQHLSRAAYWLRMKDNILQFIIINVSSASAVWASAGPVSLPQKTGRFEFGKIERAAYSEQRVNDFEERLKTHLGKIDDTFSTMNPDSQHELVRTFVKQARGFGIRVELAVVKFAQAALRANKPIWKDSDAIQILTSDINQLDKGNMVAKMLMERTKNNQKVSTGGRHE